MKNLLRSKLLAIALCLGMTANPLRAVAEDIDIFVGSSAGTHNNPNVLIVLDNTSNWSRQSQKWPGGAQQGQSEVNAIKTVLPTLDSSINVGLFEFVTGGSATDDGGFVRYAINPMTALNQANLSTTLTTIYGNVTSPNEKRNSNTAYGDLMYDVYNYFAGANAFSPNAVVASLADSNGYTTNYTRFKAPLQSANSCAKNYVIFISNPNSSGPSADGAANTTALAALGGNTAQLPLPNFTSTSTVVTSTIGNSSACYSSAAACTTAETAAATSDYVTDCTGTNSTYSSCACTTTATDPGACPVGSQRYSVIGTNNAGSTNIGTTTACYANSSACTNKLSTDYANYAANCTGTGISCACTGSGTGTGCSGNNKNFAITKTWANTTATNLGYTSACYTAQASCATTDYTALCATYNAGCACGTPTSTGSSCAAGTSKYSVSGTGTVIVNTPNGTYTTDTAPFNADEWARFMYQKGVPVTGSTTNQTVSTYTIDVYNAQPNAQNTALMMSMAKAGGGKYFNATNEAALVNALKQIFAEIVSVNSTFASASLPVNATNRAQNENQVFIGMFRPDPTAKPRWFGNLKRYQLVLGADGITVVLGDKNGLAAVNDQTGFLTDCATSFWTSDSSTFWQNYTVNPSAASTCTTTTNNPLSDAPDGPRVEKGAIAEVIRKGNNPTATDTSPTWAVNRTVYATNTAASTTLQLLSGLTTLPAAVGTTPSLKDWTLGSDVGSDAISYAKESSSATYQVRGSVHGDVVHSRPLPINYGTNITVYYGANDGTFRAVDAETGREKWAFIPYEFNSRLQRLMDNQPLINYPNVNPTIVPTPAKKDYYWDGSVGVFQNADNSKVWIYPTMRRGGRMIYALDVTNSTAPTIKWKAGCPNLTDDTGCVPGFAGIGQTWAIPNVAPIRGYSLTAPALLVGGGYDSCEDANTSAPACASPKGAAVYAIDADTGSLIASFPTARSVAADVAVIDIDGDGFADYAYVLDTGGNVYRINFTTRTVAADGTVSYTPLGSGAWTITKVAHTNGAGEGRKFLFPPALFSAGPKAGKVYVAMGTGDREHPLSSQYPYTTPVLNRFYVYLDDLSASADNNLDDAASMSDFTSDPGCNGLQIVPTSSKKGWFMSLNQFGLDEQTVTSPLIVSGLITFSTNRPIPPAQGTCSSPLGEARGYWVNLLNGSGAIQCPDGTTNCTCGGSRSATFTGGGLPPSPVIGTVPVNGQPTTVILGAPQRTGGPSSPISPQKAKPAVKATRKRVYFYIKGDN